MKKVSATRRHVAEAVFKIKRKRGSKAVRITIPDSATFADLDMKIRNAFDYDTWDHCSAFFDGAVWRSECLAELHPDGSGENNRTQIRPLTAVPGRKVSYVYDFGDNIQHDVVFEGHA